MQMSWNKVHPGFCRFLQSQKITQDQSDSVIFWGAWSCCRMASEFFCIFGWRHNTIPTFQHPRGTDKTCRNHTTCWEKILLGLWKVLIYLKNQIRTSTYVCVVIVECIFYCVIPFFLIKMNVYTVFTVQIKISLNKYLVQKETRFWLQLI